MKSILFFYKQDFESKLIFISIFFSFVVVVIYSLSVWISYKRKKREREIQRIRENRQELLSLYLFDEDKNGDSFQNIVQLAEFNPHSKQRLSKRKKRMYRQIMLNEMLDIKKNLTNQGITPLYELYKLLELFKDSYTKIKSSKYQQVVLGIRETSSMNYKYHYKEIYAFTNHPNADIRFEAQEAMVRIWQSRGLRFLSESKYDLTDWQQMSLINLLQLSNSEKPKQIGKWLQSNNHTVIIFALRLASLYNCFELLDKIYNCLSHPNNRVKIKTVLSLKNIYDENTEIRLTDYFRYVNLEVQRAVMMVLQSVASQESKSFMFEQLRNQDVEIRFLAVKILYTVSSDKEILSGFENEPDLLYDIMQMLDHVKSEENIYKQ